MKKSQKPSGIVSHATLLNQIYFEAASLTEGPLDSEAEVRIAALRAKVQAARMGVATCGVAIQAHKHKISSVAKFLGM